MLETNHEYSLGIRYVDDSAVTFTHSDPYIQTTIKRSDWDLLNQPTSIPVTLGVH